MPCGSLRSAMRCTTLRAARSTTATLSLPSSATNRSPRSGSKARWSMRPFTVPSGILASSVKGGGSAAKLGPASSRPIKAAAVVMRCMACPLFGFGAGGVLLDVHMVQGRAQPCRQLQRVVVSPEVHEEHPRLLGQHVAVQGRDLNAVSLQSLDHRIHLLGGEHEI